jgi:hypothetical protein
VKTRDRLLFIASWSALLVTGLGVLMAFAGLVWLTFLSPPLANYLFPYNVTPASSGRDR